MISGVMMESSPVCQLHYLDQPHFNGYDRKIRSISLPEPAGDRCQQEIHVVKPSDDPIVAVIGVGYVGLHLVQTFSKHFKVIAFDKSAERVSTLQRELKGISTITCTCDQKALTSATHYLIAVPTPLLPNNQVDTYCLRDAIDTVALYARPGATVVVESSVPVGMTRELMTPVMTQKGLKAGMSPERVDPGRSDPPFEDIPKIISGLNDVCPDSLDSIERLYSKVFKSIVTVSKPEVAEMMKLYENCQRMMAIAYANEMADACLGHGIDPFEVSKAACTKPFGFLPITPSLGVGGHCIPVNPYYLLSNNDFPLLQAATVKMQLRPRAIADRIMQGIVKQNSTRSDKRKAKVLVVGVAFKRGQALLTGSPAVALMQYLLSSWDVYVAFSDPLVQEGDLPYVPRLDEKTDWSKSGLEWFDAIIVALKQPGLDYALLDNLENTKVEIWN